MWCKQAAVENEYKQVDVHDHGRSDMQAKALTGQYAQMASHCASLKCVTLSAQEGSFSWCIVEEVRREYWNTVIMHEEEVDKHLPA